MTTDGTRRVALVTGGTRGLGAAIVARLAANGVTVAAAYRHDDRAADALRTELGPNAVSTYAVDIGDPEACRSLVDDVVDAHGRIDYLINNAGALVERTVQEISASDWNEALGVNLSAAFFMAQAALAPMREQRFGRIVNIGSVSGHMGSGVQVDYAAAKAGLIGLTRSLARAVARRGITVNCVVPGGFETDLLLDMTRTDRQVVEAKVPVGRFGRPAELAHIVASLVHDDAAYVTGAVIVVDGGLSMGT
ncbi:MAG: 3-oxoacyl-(acyl-carrier-protein) reductase [Actinomycetia bacterium]|nr:3-oxoacyl-(acyl-carrier-protein) reductase [Actinomycetes bacterium]